MKSLFQCCVAAGLMLAIQFAGPSDDQIPATVFAVGGADCNSSDHETFDCVELEGATNCGGVSVAASNQQACKDEKTTSTLVCTANLCQNATKDKGDSANGCTKKDCGG